MEAIKRINERLKTYFGADLDDNPYYRLVWSDSQTEIRRGYFPCGNTLILNHEKENREVKKYPNIKARYILEKKCYLPPIGELPLAELHGYSYEGIFTFEDAKGNALEPIWRAIEIIVQCSIKGPENVFTPSDAEAEEARIKEKDVEYFEQVLDNEAPYLATMLHNKEAVFLDSTKVKNNGHEPATPRHSDSIFPITSRN